MQRHRTSRVRLKAARKGRRFRSRSPSGRSGRGWVYAPLVVLSVILFALDISGHGAADTARSVAVDVTAPVLGGLASTVLTVKSWVSDTRDYAFLADELRHLRQENRELRGWRRRAHELESRSRRFEAMLKLQPDPTLQVITARTIADASSPFARSLIINAGAASGVRKGYAVLGAEGFIGRIIDHGENSARVLLVTDLASRVPVLVGPQRHRAILAGTNGPAPALLHLPIGARLDEGDLVVTSGEGRLLPADLPIGMVRLPGLDTVTVQLASDPRATEYARIIEYHVTVDVADAIPPLPKSLLDASNEPALADGAVQPAALKTADVSETGAADAAPVVAEQ